MMKIQETMLNTTTEQELHNTIKEFVNALVASSQYQAYEQASNHFHEDNEAKIALQEYQARANELRTKQMFNTLSQQEQDELQRLWMKFLSFKSVQVYLEAQESFQSLCRISAQIISDHCGLDYATACGASCCG